MDVNVNTDVKAYGIPVVPTTVAEDQVKPQIPPVPENNGGETATLDEKVLHGREIVDQRGGGQLSGEEVVKLAKDLQKRVDPFAVRLNFSIDEDTETLVLKVTDRQTGEVIRQVPPEALLHLRANLRELVGLLYDQKV